MCQPFELNDRDEYPAGLASRLRQMLITQGFYIRHEGRKHLLVEVAKDWVPPGNSGYWWIANNGGELQVCLVNGTDQEGIPITTSGKPLGRDVTEYAGTILYRIMARIKGQGETEIDWTWRYEIPEIPERRCKACQAPMAHGARACDLCEQVCYMPVTRKSHKAVTVDNRPRPVL